MGVGAGLDIYDVVVEKFTFAISSSDRFFTNLSHHRLPSSLRTDSTALWLDSFFWASRFLVYFLH